MESQQVLGKRAINKEKIRATIITEATKLFSTKGYESTTVADIVSASNIGRGTFYNYFADVKDLFDHVVDSVTYQISTVTKAARAKESNIYDMLLASFLAYFNLVSSPELKGFHDKNQAYIRSASYKSASIKKIVKELIDDLKKIKTPGTLADSKQETLLSYVLIAAPAELFLNNMSVNESFSNEEVALFLAQLFTSGLDKIA